MIERFRLVFKIHDIEVSQFLRLIPPIRYEEVRRRRRDLIIRNGFCEINH